MHTRWHFDASLAAAEPMSADFLIILLTLTPHDECPPTNIILKACVHVEVGRILYGTLYII